MRDTERCVGAVGYERERAMRVGVKVPQQQGAALREIAEQRDERGELLRAIEETREREDENARGHREIRREADARADVGEAVVERWIVPSRVAARIFVIASSTSRAARSGSPSQA